VVWIGDAPPGPTVPDGSASDPADASAPVGAGASASANPTAARFALTAGGAGVDVSADTDGFLFVHQKVAGDVRLQAVVRALADCPPGRVTFGVMVRASLAPGSPYAMAALSGSPGAALQVRRLPDVFASSLRIDNQVPLPLWVRVGRQGVRVTAGYSRDGISWREGQLDLTGLGTEVHMGLVASSHGGATACSGLLDGVSLETR
jgi:hypothetical protein